MNHWQCCTLITRYQSRHWYGSIHIQGNMIIMIQDKYLKVVWCWNIYKEWSTYVHRHCSHYIKVHEGTWIQDNSIVIKWKRTRILWHIMHVVLTKHKELLCCLHGGAGTGKSHVIKALYHGLYRLLCASVGENEDIFNLLTVAPTCKAA